MDFREKSRLNFYLGRLKNNLPAASNLPTLDEVLEDQRQNQPDLRAALLTANEAVERFYAAVLLWALDREQAQRILNDLKNDKTSLLVQNSVGFGSSEMPLFILVEDFLNDESFPGTNLVKAERLANWANSVRSEKRKAGAEYDATTLPKYDEIIKARTSADKRRLLDSRIEDLKKGSVAERFYAAAVLNELDREKSREILENLLDENEEVGISRGDVMMNIPASQAAADLLNENNRVVKQRIKNPIARFFKWFGD